ncbi:hypothetical protein CAPTEDRAFT_195634 [Capitella teleta]|uniref:DDE Tnp4 domain-containing protein n=1 Tax=Capitella teleta TaxID=283909 RepID=R7VED1_CAPTE|nr:hypothetical protein CAPTEDRAFT_195634 [Capitella teleta]|eukprot:ELU17168.1 hypothetical protein CAPTEDRAFT_195634 [Capitella teleta]
MLVVYPSPGRPAGERSPPSVDRTAATRAEIRGSHACAMKRSVWNGAFSSQKVSGFPCGYCINVPFEEKNTECTDPRQGNEKVASAPNELHLEMRSPANAGSSYYNYKRYHSIVLLAMVDANYCFIGLEIGAPESCSDAGVFDRSRLGRLILNGLHGIPPDALLPRAPHFGKLSYVVVGRRITQEQQVFNYRLSRARRVSENAFAQVASRWRIFRTKLAVDPPLAKKIVKASGLLHNYLRLGANIPEDGESKSDNIFAELDPWPSRLVTIRGPCS